MGCGLHYDMSRWPKTTRSVIDRMGLYSRRRRGRDGGVDIERSYAMAAPGYFQSDDAVTKRRRVSGKTGASLLQDRLPHARHLRTEHGKLRYRD